MSKPATRPERRARALDVAATLAASPEEGARRLALHWLEALADARARWQDDERESAALAAGDDGTRDAAAADDDDVLHKARVAIRRLRAVLREHRGILSVDEAVPTLLRELNQATNAARDADVQRAWLEEARPTLNDDAAREAGELAGQLEQGRRAERKAVTKAFRKRFDPAHDRMHERLAVWKERRRLGGSDRPLAFAHHVATRVRKGADHVAAELAAIGELVPGGAAAALPDLATQERLHELRIRLKRQRALLAPFTDAHEAIEAWYDLATQGQDTLGEMRDAAILAEVAASRGFTALPGALQDVALERFRAFMSTWCASDETVSDMRRTAELAAQALEHLGRRGPAPVGPAVDGDHDPDAAAGAPPEDDGVPREIERKYLLRGVPPRIRTVAPIRIEQGWLPGSVLRERLRRATAQDGTVRHTRTVKFGPLGSRVELEEEATAELFEALWPHTTAARIRKDRHPVSEGEFTWEIDVFLDRELVLAEVELDAGDAVPEPPEWLAEWIVRDVTEDASYTNSAMARPDRARSG